MSNEELERASAKLSRLVLDGVLSPQRTDDVATAINNACKQALSLARAEGYAECREDAARLLETTVLLADDDDPTLDRGKYATAIRALTPNEVGDERAPL